MTEAERDNSRPENETVMIRGLSKIKPLDLEQDQILKNGKVQVPVTDTQSCGYVRTKGVWT
ncbi:MAG: hypothetical protein DWQ31_13725 [Planctomycetota bacterium]|nr:MAG: hypothetical protein DWQ31_13725 [Planctomycetota bacterium]REJ95022.1 MAG: hypothetical protein DWQ35_07150 [Planctomycetota bacterium]REK28438.1 MAG: hypothetical protein DWQ42_05170 [Planctomycetota bacterium]REK48826.1 MAG: hypothetical protein DWQ46_01370 [Planctomycetota bacterium]